MNPSVVIIHGTKGAPSGNWFPWIASALQAKSCSVSVLEMPTPKNQSYENWKRMFLPYAEHSRSTIYIGHSCGGAFLLRALEEALFSPLHVSLVSPVCAEIGNAEYDALNKTFIEPPLQWERIRKARDRVSLFYGDDDPYVPLAQTEQIASSLGIVPRRIPGGKHLNAEAGFYELRELLDFLVMNDLFRGMLNS